MSNPDPTGANPANHRVAVNIIYEPATGKIALSAPLQTEDLKKMTIKILAQAICTALDYKPSPLLAPSVVPPPADLNGR